MNKGTKIALIVALCCIGLGLVLFLFGLSMVGFDGFDFDSLRNGSVDTTNSVVKTASVSETFSNIEIADVECDLFILPSADGSCHVEYTDSDLYIHEIEVKGDTLTISREDIGSWEDHIFVMWGDNTYVKVYLPADTYEDLDLSTVSGDIHVERGFTFANMDAASTSGNIGLFSQVEKSVDISTTSGSIEISSAGSEEMSLNCVSGDISLEDMDVGDLSASTTSGDITLDRVLIAGMMDLDTASGDIELEEVDSESANCSTGSGDISGDILKAKDFRADTGSGEIRVPRSDPNAGIWDLSTGSGDIHLNISE